MRLIDADTLRKDVEKDRDASDMPKMWYQGVEYAINHIIHAPTVDAVEVVRCKDCVYFWDGVCTTHTDAICTDENEFCSWGREKMRLTDDVNDFFETLIEIRRWCMIYLATQLPFWVLLLVCCN